MHELALDRTMNNALKRFQRNHTPNGPGVRPMTAEERDHYAQSTQDSFEMCKAADNMSFQGVAIDRDPAKGKVRWYDRQTSYGDEFNTEYVSKANATFDSRRHSFQLNTRETQRDLVEGGETRSERSLSAGHIGRSHISGIEMHRQGNTFGLVQYNIDLRHPENSVIFEQAPATARSFPQLG